MDVVNGKIVSARTERSSAEAWGTLKPSLGRTLESIHGSPEQMRGNGLERAASWATPSSFSDENPLHAWGAVAPCYGPPNSLALEPSGARWNHRPSSEKLHSGALHEFCGVHPKPVVEHRQGWGGDHRHYHSRARPCSERNLDQMMTMYESQITRAVSGHFAKAVVPSSTLGQETPTLALPCDKSEECWLQRSVSDAGSKQEISEAQSSHKSTVVGTSSDLKRKRSEMKCSEEADQAECGWSHPLKLLVRKGLSVSDVGELGRIIIPKKDAESQFEQIDAKEGSLLEMEDYSGSKRWLFRFKWWINNKSRMYVLENTGKFIKYHSLKEHDIFVVYEDGSRKLVVRGHKGTDLNSTVDILQGANGGSSSDKISSINEEGPASSPAVA